MGSQRGEIIYPLRVCVSRGRLVVGGKSGREVRDGSPEKMIKMLGGYPGIYT